MICKSYTRIFHNHTMGMRKGAIKAMCGFLNTADILARMRPPLLRLDKKYCFILFYLSRVENFLIRVASLQSCRGIWEK